AFAFVAIFFSHVPFPLIVLAAGVMCLVGGRAGAAAFIVGEGHGGGNAHAAQDSALGDEMPEHARPTVGRALRVSAIWLVLWLGPVIAIVATLGLGHTFSEIGLFFSKMAVVTFGGAYAVLAYMAQQAVETYGWLRPGEMLDGLGMAETTPGPLIMVVQFVGFMAAYRDPGPGGVVRAAHLVTRHRAGRRLRFRFRHAGLDQSAPLGAAAVTGGDGRDLPLQGRHDPDARRLLRRRGRPLSGRPRRAVSRL